MKRIAFLGGAFDPPHIGHVLMITEVLNSGLVDEVWIMPTGKHIEKELKTSPSDRTIMAELMVEEFFQKREVRISYLDLVSPKPLTSFEVFKMLGKNHPDIEFRMIIGSDLVLKIPNWFQEEELLKIGKFLVIPRLGFTEKNKEGDFIYLEKDIVKSNISSTLVRKRLEKEELVEGLIPPKVLDFIDKNNLYRKERE